MSGTKFTPGPWVRDTRTDDVKRADTFAVVAYTAGIGVPVPIKEANANLIAAAPDLFEHAVWVVRLFGTKDPQGLEELAESVKGLRAAVAKARGEA